jgi:hypothetical protein
MAVQGVWVALSTEDVARSVKFYLEQLGFICALQLGALHGFGWALQTLCSRTPMPICHGRSTLYRLDPSGRN